MNTIPAHRGGRSASAPPLHAPHAALLIDFDNVTLGIRSDLTKELRHLLDSDIIKGKVSVQRAYADWRRYPQYIVPLSESSIDLIFAPAFGTNKKNATDIRLAIDAAELVFTRPEIGTFILLSGDSDFSSLVIKLKEYGKYVIGVGIRESASDILIQNCDEYYSYSDLAGLTREVDTPSTQRDPWELVTEAVDQMVANRDVMRADRLKQVMQQLDPNFDERNAGFNRFSKFVQEAGTRGLIAVSKLENGQFEVAPARSAGATPSERPKGGREGTESRPPRREPAAGRSRGGRGRGKTEPKAEAEVEAKPEVKDDAKAEPAADPEKERSRRRRGGRGRGRGRGEEKEAAAKAAPPRRDDQELTLAEAFHLMSRALGELPAPVPHETLRARMAALHGREDPLLEAATFVRLLRQANDAEIADVRMIDDEHFEVSPHKADLALQLRSPVSQPAGDGASAPVRNSTSLRYRSGSGSAKRNAEVPMVGVVKLDNQAAAGRGVEGRGGGGSQDRQEEAQSPQDGQEEGHRREEGGRQGQQGQARQRQHRRCEGGQEDHGHQGEASQEGEEAIDRQAFEEVVELSPDAVALARDLLGTVLASDLGGERVSGRIIETEAYLGIPDPASHAWQGRQRRDQMGIWSPPGSWYVYRSHGLHWCLNLTAGPTDMGAAVLIRAIEPLEGLAVIRRRRGAVPDRALTDGPGKLCQALGITGALDGIRADATAPVHLEGPCGDADARRVVATPRIGISRAADWPLRFVLR